MNGNNSNEGANRHMSKEEHDDNDNNGEYHHNEYMIIENNAGEEEITGISEDVRFIIEDLFILLWRDLI